MSDIFISYASEDKGRVQALARALERKGWSVWWDRRIPAGKSFDDVIHEALKAARSVVVVWTKTSVKSTWVKNESRSGLRRNILFPVMLLEEVEIPLEFEHLQAAHLMDWQLGQDHAGFNQFVEDLARIIGVLPNTVSQPTPVIQGSLPPSVSPPSETESLQDHNDTENSDQPVELLADPHQAELSSPSRPVSQADQERLSTMTGSVPSTQSSPSPPYLAIGGGLLAVIGVVVVYWLALSNTSPSKGESPPLQAALKISPTHREAATQSPTAASLEKSDSASPHARPTLDQKPRAIPESETRASKKVFGRGCYTYGDNETPAQARQEALRIAQGNVLQSSGVFVQQTTRVKNFQVEDDVLHTASTGLLEQTEVENEEVKGQTICIAISARLGPRTGHEMIQQRINAKDIANEAANSPALSLTPGFGVRVWTNKAGGRFVEGERLIIYVMPERDGYLKVDYFQADGKVVHIVPNISRGQAMVNAGQIYAFGGDASPDKFIIKPPYGNEVVKAMLSVRPFEFPDLYKTVEDSREYRKNLDSGARGIKLSTLEGSVSSVFIVTSSKMLYKGQDTRK